MLLWFVHILYHVVLTWKLTGFFWSENCETFLQTKEKRSCTIGVQFLEYHTDNWQKWNKSALGQFETPSRSLAKSIPLRICRNLAKKVNRSSLNLPVKLDKHLPQENCFCSRYRQKAGNVCQYRSTYKNKVGAQDLQEAEKAKKKSETRPICETMSPKVIWSIAVQKFSMHHHGSWNVCKIRL